MSDHYPTIHHRSEDGLQLIIEEARPDGAYITTLEWVNRKEADKNWEQALRNYSEREIGDTLNQVGQTNRTRRLGRGWYFTVLAGPPTWWLPRADLSWTKRKVMLGWLRRGYVLAKVSREQ